MEIAGIKLEFFPTRTQRFNNHKNDSTFLYHVSSPLNRNSILTNGLRLNDSKDEYSRGMPVIFASKDINNLFLGGKGDIWKIDTTKIPNHEWKDDEELSYGVYTTNPIPPYAIELIPQ